MDAKFSREFNLCPNCGSDQRFFEQLGNELKERKLAPENWSQVYDTKQGVVMDPAYDSKIPVGAHLPGFSILTDVCMECGTIYAIQLLRGEAVKSVKMPIQGKPFNFGNDPRFS